MGEWRQVRLGDVAGMKLTGAAFGAVDPVDPHGLSGGPVLKSHALSEVAVRGGPVGTQGPVRWQQSGGKRGRHRHRYPGGGTGRLIYIRKALERDAPTDLLAYQAARPLFPYDGTGGQFYDFEQFEAYRRLGVRTSTQAVQAYRSWTRLRAGSGSEAGS